MFYNDTENKSGRNGTGFCTNSKIENIILGFEPVNGTLSKLRVKGLYNNFTLILPYALTEDATEKKKDLFFTKLKGTYHKQSKYDITFILEDFNANVLIQNCNRNVADKYLLHEKTSDNGKRICNF